jgi:TolA-binding protein
MNKMLVIGTSVFFTLFAGAANAVDEHHPADTKPAVTSTSQPSSPPANAATAQSAQAGMQMQQMEQMMQKMQGMHDNMMAGKTPAERQKLMDEHSKLMQDCMVMMKDTGGNDGAMMNGKANPGMMMNRGTGDVPMSK